ncbi:MAG: aminotransferase [Candidatus Puniceispirillum sp.]|nr:aminotransferase [Candidatus Puniceispirillum sp.]MBL6774500.1 aminotransferase [Candidatus Puniceispirillum sp.]
MFNSAVATLNAPPVSVVLNWKSSYDGANGPLIDMSQAVPGYPSHPDILAALAVAAADPALARYGPVEGDADFRHAYADHVSHMYKAHIDQSEVQVTSGCNQAFVATVLAIASHGDRILMIRPCYFNHESSLGMLGVGIDYVDCDADAGLLPDCPAIDAAIGDQTRAVALVSPNNPAGSIYPAPLLAEILDLCRHRGIWLILDETYRDFLPLDQDLPHHLFAEDNWQSNLIQLYSFSKSYCLPGHRLGAIIAGRDVVFQLAKVIDNIQICAPRVVQNALAPMLASMSSWRQENRQRIAARVAAFRTAMDDLPGWDLLSSGAYFGYVRHPFPGVNSLQVAETMASKAGVLVIPGAFFGAGQDRALRFAFANAGRDVIAQLGSRLSALTP